MCFPKDAEFHSHLKRHFIELNIFVNSFNGVCNTPSKNISLKTSTVSGRNM